MCILHFPPLSLLEVSIYTCIFLFDSSVFIKYHVKYVLKYTNPGDIVIEIEVDHHFPLESCVFVSTSLFSVQVKISMFRTVKVYSWNRNKPNYYYQSEKNKIHKWVTCWYSLIKNDTFCGLYTHTYLFISILWFLHGKILRNYCSRCIRVIMQC